MRITTLGASWVSPSSNARPARSGAERAKIERIRRDEVSRPDGRTRTLALHLKAGRALRGEGWLRGSGPGHLDARESANSLEHGLCDTCSVASLFIASQHHAECQQPVGIEAGLHVEQP